MKDSPQQGPESGRPGRSQRLAIRLRVPLHALDRLWIERDSRAVDRLGDGLHALRIGTQADDVAHGADVLLNAVLAADRD